MTKPRLPQAHETPTPSDVDQPFVVLLMGDEHEEGERMAAPPLAITFDATLRRELTVLLEAIRTLEEVVK